MTKNIDGTVTLTNAEYEELIERDAFLCDLEGAGVDNWDGYSYACDARALRRKEDE